MADRRPIAENAITNKFAPVVFLPDISGSMLYPGRLTMMNWALETIINRWMDIEKVRQVTEVSFMPFADRIYLDSKFSNIRWMDETMFQVPRDPDGGGITWKQGRAQSYPEVYRIPQFGHSERDNGTDIGLALLTGIHKLEAQVAERKQYYGTYPAFLVLITDGNPDFLEESPARQQQLLQRQQEAKLALAAHSQHDLIIPIFVGVSQTLEDKNRLRDILGKGNDCFYFEVNEGSAQRDWDYIARIMAQSVSNSINWTDYKYEDFRNHIRDARE